MVARECCRTSHLELTKLIAGSTQSLAKNVSVTYILEEGASPTARLQCFHRASYKPRMNVRRVSETYQCRCLYLVQPRSKGRQRWLSSGTRPPDRHTRTKPRCRTGSYGTEAATEYATTALILGVTTRIGFTGQVVKS